MIRNHIVYIDDEDFLCDILKETLAEETDYQISTFTKGDQARVFIEENKDTILCVIIDLHLGSQNGISLRNELSSGPLYFLTSGEKISKTPAQIGFDAILLKPFHWTDLTQALQKILA